MTTISRDDVARLATLSNIRLSEDEAVSLQKDLGAILDYVEQLNELDTTNVSPTYQVTGLSNIWRDDVVSQGAVTPEQLVGLAADHHDGQISVKKVL